MEAMHTVLVMWLGAACYLLLGDVDRSQVGRLSGCQVWLGEGLLAPGCWLLAGSVYGLLLLRTTRQGSEGASRAAVRGRNAICMLLAALRGLLSATFLDSSESIWAWAT